MKNKVAKTKSISNQVVLAALKKKAGPTISKLKKITKISSQKEFNEAAEQMKFVKKIGKEATAEKKSMLLGIKQTEAKIRAFFAPFEKDIVDLENDIKEHMSKFLEAQKKVVKQINQSFSSGKIAKISTYNNKIAATKVKGVRELKDLVIKDINKIPRDYMVPDEGKIKEALLAGEKVPGCELGTKQSIAI